MLLTHLTQHAGFVTVLPTGVADLLIGYPTALGLGLGAAVVLTTR